MENKRNDKKTLLIMAVLFSFLAISIIFWCVFDYLNSGKKNEGIGVIAIALTIVVFGLKLIKDKYDSLKQGEPLKDERSKKLETKAAACAFYIGIYWLLGLSIAIDNFGLSIPASSVPSLGIAGMAIIFGLSYWYFSKRGE